MRTTFLDVKNGRVPEAINISASDSRFAQYVNEAQRRLLTRGHWWGTFGRFTVSVTSQILAQPPQIAAIEQIAVGNSPLPLRSMWFEMNPAGWGPRDGTLPNGSGISEALYRGNFPTIVDIATAGVLTVKCDFLTDVNKSVLILGYDQNGNWIRTAQSGLVSDGEVVTLAQGAGNNTVKQFSRVTDIQPPSNLDGQWWLYSGGTSGTLLGNYQYWDTRPSYPRWLIPFINTTVSTVVLIGKLAFIPVVKDNDYLIIQNIAAIKLGCMAILAEDDHNWPEANLLWNGGKDKKTGQRILGAIDELELELQHYTGDGQEIGICVKGSNLGAIEEVPVLQ